MWFLCAVPFYPEHRLSNADMLISVRRWIRLPVIRDLPAGHCCCSTSNRLTELSEQHLLNCKLMGMVTYRHDELRGTLRDMFVSAGLVAREEPRVLPGFGQGGGDILVLNYTHDGRDAIADVTVVNSQRADLTVAAAVQPCRAARQAEHRKHLKYGEACANLNMKLLPLAIELDGSFGPTLVSIIARCRDSTADVCPVPTTWAAATYSQYWTQRLSVTLHRGTARALQTITRANKGRATCFLQEPDYGNC